MPGDRQRLTDVSVALDRVGQLIREQGDPNGSRNYFEEALKIDRALHKRSTTRRDWQENLVFSLTPDRRPRPPARPAARGADAL